MRNFFIILFVALSLVANGADLHKTVKGIVSFPDSTVYPYTVVLIGKQGETAKQIFNKESFVMKAPLAFNAIEISSFGFEKTLVPAKDLFSQGDTISVGRVFLKPASHSLEEVSVSAPLESVKYDGMNYTIMDIKGSALGETGSMLDMLSWAPGISVGPDSKIQVFGVEGSPIVYLNDIKISDLSQIETLSSKMVKSIEVIRKPGAEYPAGTSSVIRICTEVPLSEILNASVTERASIFRRYSNSSALNLWGAHRKLIASVSLRYQVKNNRQFAEAWESVKDRAGESLKDIYTAETDNIHAKRWMWLGGLTWNPTASNSFQIQYSGNTQRSGRIFENKRTRTIAAGSETIDYDSRNCSKPSNHSVIGAFTHEFSNSDLNITVTYNSKTRDSEERVVDKADEQLLQLNARNSTGTMWTSKADYNWKLGKGPRQSAGIYVGRSFSRSNSDYSFTGLQNSNSSVCWGEAFYSLSWDIFHCNVRAGVRGRYESQKYDVTLAETTYGSDRSHFNVVPNLSVFHRFTKKYAMNLYYKYDYSLPSFSELNPAMVVDDLMFFETGNPDLKTPRTHDVAVVANLPSLMLVAEYMRFENRIMSVTSVIDNSDYFLVRPENMNGNYNLSFSASYNIAPVKNLRIYANALVRRSHVEYKYLDELIRRNRVMTQLWANVNYQPVKPLSLFLRARYTSPQLFENIRVGYSCDLSCGASLRLFKSKLNLSLEINDVLGKMVTPSWQSFSPNLHRARINRYDTRGIVFTARYTFSVVGNDYDELDDADDLDRM